MKRFLAMAIALTLWGCSSSSLWAAAGDFNIESGMYISDSIFTNTPELTSEPDRFFFYAEPGDRVLFRTATEDGTRRSPDLQVFYEQRGAGATNFVAETAPALANGVKIDTYLPITKTGWYFMRCNFPADWVGIYSNPISYSVSMLRLPAAPLSTADGDVGTLRSGESKSGNINVRADLDQATFSITNRCHVLIRMGQGAAGAIPDVWLFNPSGIKTNADYPPEYRSFIDMDLTATGIYSIVFNDYMNAAAAPYSISLAKIPGTVHLSAADPDFGPILSGETKTGTIHVPGDLDVATFVAQSNDLVYIEMSETTEANLNPVVELYDPSGNLLERAEDYYQEISIITTHLMTNGTYYIVCYDAEDRSAVPYSLYFSRVTASTNSMPETPSGVNATDGGYLDQIVVNWNMAINATGYEVFRSTDLVTWTVFTNASASFTDSNVVPHVTYYYKVHSFNSSFGKNTNDSNVDSGWCGVSGGRPIESGQYFSLLSDESFTFYAIPGETIIIRTGVASPGSQSYPGVAVYDPSGNPVSVTAYAANEFMFQTTALGWYYFSCNSVYSYSVSLLRIPNAPLSYADTDVGELKNGESKLGTLAVPSDLDAGFVVVSNACTVQIRMGQGTPSMVPNIRLFDPVGNPVTNDYPPEYRAEITSHLTMTGIYTVVASDKFSSQGSYYLTMVKMTGAPEGADSDFGPILNGEYKVGKIDVPGDLDIATFEGAVGQQVRIEMRKIDTDMNPVLELFDPSGNLLVHTNDNLHQVAVITNTLATNGIFSILCKDAEDRFGMSYSLSFSNVNGAASNSPPGVPANLTASDGLFSDRITVSWSALTNATGYDLLRRMDTNYVQVCTNYSSTTYTDLAVTTNEVYYYQVRARNTHGVSAYSAADAGFVATHNYILSGKPLESGQYFAGSLLKLVRDYETYTFYAASNETVLIRTGIGDPLRDPYPTLILYNPDGSSASNLVTTLGQNEARLNVQQMGWHYLVSQLPGVVSGMNYSVSILRMPNAPLSYADLDVGPLQNGQSKLGTIAVAADLDAGFLSVSEACTVQLRMGQGSPDMVANIRLFDPSGNPVTNDFPPEYRAEVTARLTVTGIYTVVCSEKFNASGIGYALTMARIPGQIEGTDPDFGPIVNGELKIGTIDQPGDIDMATFSGEVGDRVSIVMTKIDPDMNPVLELYDPQGNRLFRTNDPFQIMAMISNYTLTTNGTYTILCKDAEDRTSVKYALQLNFQNVPTNLLPATPESISATDGAFTNRILVTWSAVSNVTGYDILRRYSTNISLIVVDWPDTSYSDTNVTTNGLYYYQVRSRNASGVSVYSTNDSGYCTVQENMAAGTALESGQYFSDFVYWGYTTNYAQTFQRYTFYAMTNETIIVRLGHDPRDPYLDFAMYNPPMGAGAVGSPATTTKVGDNEYHVSVVQNGWHDFVVSAPPWPTVAATNWYWYWGTIGYNVSMIRIPNAPLSYADLDVGPLPNGASKLGQIGVSSDLDAGFFPVSNACTVQIRMGQLNPSMVPNIRLFDPNGQQVTNDFPPEYRAEINARLTGTGIYTIVCSDKFNANGPYALTLVRIPGALDPGDSDFGYIANNETKVGTLNQPGDLDLAIFNAVTGDVVQITMTKIDVDMAPVLDFYDPSGNLLVHVSDPFQTSAQITNFAIPTNGTYTVICKDKEDRYGVTYSLTLNVISGSSTNSMPGVPTGLNASDGAFTNKVQVTWSSADGALGYDLYRSQGTNPAVQLSTNWPNLLFDDAEVVPGVMYWYKLKSRNAYGLSAFSESDSGYAQASTVAPTSSVRRALLVGIDHYAAAYGPSDLTGCTNDAIGLRDVMLLGDPSNRWASTNLQVLLDRQATKATIQSVLHTLAVNSGAGDLVVYTHASHGGQSNAAVNPSNAFVCAYDASYYDSELGSDLALFLPDTKVVVIIDTCYSGGMFRDVNARSFNEIFVENVMKAYRESRTAQLKRRGLAVPRDLGGNIAFMTACEYNQLSNENPEIRHGLYTAGLLEACQTTLADTDGDGQYSFLELHLYASNSVVNRVSDQTPQVFHATLLSNTVARAVGSNVTVITHLAFTDYDGDKADDLAVYNETTGLWYIASLKKQVILAWGLAWGGPGYRPVGGDYDADRISDLAVYNEGSGAWAIASLAHSVILAQVVWGGPGYTPVSGDYNGDRTFDGAVYNKDSGFWYVMTSTGIPLVLGSSLVGPGFSAVPGDYDGDRLSDYAQYHDAQGYWYIVSATGTTIVWGQLWGAHGARPVTGDYDGDGYYDLAVYVEATGFWYVYSFKKQGVIVEKLAWGGPGYTAVPGDFNGDGLADFAVYNETYGAWYVRTLAGSSVSFTFGGLGCRPVLPAW